jgi:hypothetical protein
LLAYAEASHPFAGKVGKINEKNIPVIISN